MADGIVTTGMMATLAQQLTKKLGRRVVVHRVEYKIRLPGRGSSIKTQIRYSLGIGGSQPPVFFNMTTSEVKERMAMLLDLLVSGVICAGSPTEDVRRGERPDHQPEHSEAPQGGFTGSLAAGQVPGAPGSGEGEHQPPDDDEPY